jgi:predicted dehydrogenase
MAKIFNWGILGLGRIAHKFAADLALLPNARLHAAAARDMPRARAFADQYGVPHAYGAYEDLAACPELDVVYIATPHVGHCENTLFCLENGLPVLCEKPFAMNAAQAERMVAKAREKNIFLMEAIWTRFLPPLREALRIIESGELGRVLSVKADFGFPAPFDPQSRLFNAELGGGALLDIGIYPAFLARLLLGNPSGIRALARIGPTGVDEECGATLSFADGGMAHLHASIRFRTKTEAFIYGEKGTINLHTRWHEPTAMTLLLEKERPRHFTFEYRGAGYHAEAEEVMRCLEAGETESASLPLSFSLDLMRLLDDIRGEAGIRYPADARR